MAFGGDKVNIWLLDLLLYDFSFTNICQFFVLLRCQRVEQILLTIKCQKDRTQVARESLKTEGRSLVGHWYGRGFLWLHVATDKWLFRGHWCRAPITWTLSQCTSMFCPRTDKWMKMVYTCIINITGYWEISLTLLYPVTLKPLSVICRRKYIGYSISYQGQSNSFYYKGSWSKFVFILIVL